MVALLGIFALFHSGLAGLRPKGELGGWVLSHPPPVVCRGVHVHVRAWMCVLWMGCERSVEM